VRSLGDCLKTREPLQKISKSTIKTPSTKIKMRHIENAEADFLVNGGRGEF
jgi:hypothetical protein